MFGNVYRLLQCVCVCVFVVRWVRKIIGLWPNWCLLESSLGRNRRPQSLLPLSAMMSIHVANHRLLLPRGIPLSTTAQALNKVTEYNDRVYRHLESGSAVGESSECWGVSLQISVSKTLQYKRTGLGARLMKAFTSVIWIVGGLFAMVCVEGGLEKQHQRMKGRVVVLLLHTVHVGNGRHGMSMSLFHNCFFFSHKRL